MNSFSNLFASAYTWSSNPNVFCWINGRMIPCHKETFVLFGIIWLTPFIFFITFIASVFAIAGIWKIFSKAGKPGWASIVPVYNLVVMLEVIDRPIWWILLYFIPFVNMIVALIVVYELSKMFKKGIGFTLGLVFFPFIFYPILGFGKSEYHRHEVK